MTYNSDSGKGDDDKIKIINILKVPFFFPSDFESVFG